MYGERIRKLRKEIGLNQSDLAKMTGVSRPNVSFWENADYPPLEAIAKICRALKIDIWKFFLQDEMYENLEISSELQDLFREMNELSNESLGEIIEIVNILVRRYRKIEETGICDEPINGFPPTSDFTEDTPESNLRQFSKESRHYHLPFYARKAGSSALSNYFSSFAWLEH